jgi:hypothetical protein
VNSAATATQDQVRILAIQHGIPEASRISGVKQDTIYKWAKRKHWNVTAHSQAVQTVQSSIPAALEDELTRSERETRLSLARSVKRLSKDAEQATLRNSGEVKNVAQTAAIVHRWDQRQAQANVMVNIALLGVNPGEVSAKAIDVSEAD